MTSFPILLRDNVDVWPECEKNKYVNSMTRTPRATWVYTPYSKSGSKSSKNEKLNNMVYAAAGNGLKERSRCARLGHQNAKHVGNSVEMGQIVHTPLTAVPCRASDTLPFLLAYCTRFWQEFGRNHVFFYLFIYLRSNIKQ